MIRSNHEKRNSRSIMALFCVLWALSIVVTSSTVITPQAFFDWFREHVFNNEDAFERAVSASFMPCRSITHVGFGLLLALAAIR